MSRFNTLYLGEPGDAAEELEHAHGDPEADRDEIRVALINALRRIERLERALAQVQA